MPNLQEIENSMPVAPLKIIALSSAKKMGERVNDYLVEFRKTIHNDKVKTDPAFQGYSENNYLLEVETPALAAAKAKLPFRNLSAEKTCSFWWMSAITASHTICTATSTICRRMTIIRT